MSLYHIMDPPVYVYVKHTDSYVLMYNMMDYDMMDILMYALIVVLVLHPHSN